jgi:hypothetical protein
MSKVTDKRCPKCGQFTASRDRRECVNPACRTALYWDGDEPLKTGVVFFMWHDGPRGLGWYRRASIQMMYANA